MNKAREERIPKSDEKSPCQIAPFTFLPFSWLVNYLFMKNIIMAFFLLNPFFHFACHRNCICIAYCVTENQLENVGYSIISIINRTNASLQVFIYTPNLFEKKNSIFDILERKYPKQIEFFFDTMDFELC